MWSLFKSMVGLVVVGALAYAAFFINVGDKPIAAHLSDVWHAPIIQEKIDLVRGEVKQEISERLAKANADQQPKRRKKPHEEISAADKRALDSVIIQSTRPAKKGESDADRR
ncbi:MAG: hypothetical protein R3C68_10700 [Myxococcota bacterium]